MHSIYSVNEKNSREKNYFLYTATYIYYWYSDLYLYNFMTNGVKIYIKTIARTYKYSLLHMHEDLLAHHISC